VAALRGAVARGSTFTIERLERFGADYARTLAHWRANLERHRGALRRLGYGEPFLRTFEYYLSYCEAGFRTGELDVCQFVLARPADGATPAPRGA
jgi:cyclopropane-fatty-acyl-phospholipid synthase